MRTDGETLPDGPLAATLGRLGALETWWAATIGEPAGEGWHRLDRLVDDGKLASWVDAAAERNGGRRDVAGSFVGMWVSGALISVPVAALVIERRVPDLRGSGLWGRVHADGWIDAVAFETGRAVVLAEDADAAHADAMVVPDVEALLDAYAAELVRIVEPVLEEVRCLTPFGRRGLWGAVADEIASSAVWAARVSGGNSDEAWRLHESLTDAVASRVSWLRARPRRFDVAWDGGRTVFPVRGACCLYYKTPEGAAAQGDGYCTTCPLRDDESRHERLVAHLATPDGAEVALIDVSGLPDTS